MKAAIFANGDFIPEKGLVEEIKSAELIICADGGALWAQKSGIQPHVLIGDMDSTPEGLPERMAQAGVQVIYLERKKNVTDAEAAVELALSRGADEFIIAGATGYRLDHTLGNIMLLVKLVQLGKKAKLCGGGQSVLAACGDVEIRGEKGRIISIIPFGQGLLIESTEGLRYPIKNGYIPGNTTLGISNVFTSDTARVKIKSGMAVIIMQDA
ncbi:MAG: thiamine diphosphokinase [Bacillota bacterium]|nr:thiamine diphosphokinase [Bacillota bacterium]